MTLQPPLCMLGKNTLFGLVLLVLCATSGVAQSPIDQTAPNQSPVDPTLPLYERSQDLQGTLKLVGSNTMSNVAAIWEESFRRMYPDVKIEVEVKGSVNAVGAVIDGTADFGLLSREITQDEVKAFYEKFGYVPTILTPVLEPQGIFVHKNNPIESISLSQLDAAFSTTLKRGEPKVASTWGDLGVQGEWSTVPIVVHGRSATTGSQLFFQSAILGGGEFRPDMVAHQSNPELIEAIAKDPRGIGFAGSTFDNPDVKLVPLSWRNGTPAVDVYSSRYPLVRRLQLVVNNNPQQPLDPLRMEFVKYVFSRSGQQDVVISGFLPVPAGAANIALQAVGEKTLN